MRSLTHLTDKELLAVVAIWQKHKSYDKAAHELDLRRSAVRERVDEARRRGLIDASVQGGGAPKLTDAVCKESMSVYLKTGTATEAARFLGIPIGTMKSRLAEAKRRGFTAEQQKDLADDTVKHLQLKVKSLESQLRESEKERLTHGVIRNEILKLADTVVDVETPSWLIPTPKSSPDFGVPTLLVSDLHAGEVVDSKQINGVNSYDLKIFHARMAHLADRSIRLLKILNPQMDYPGIVIPLGGDNISGNIHDELTATNEFNSMPVVLDLFETLGSFLTTMANTFGRVFVPCVTGNHGRDTRKIWNKDRHHTSFDWLLYNFLAKHFAADQRITFQIPDAPDAYYKIYNYRYCLTHGDQFRSFGDSMIGSLGPIIRGDVKKRSRNMQIDLSYDTMIMGHWHQYIHMNRLIVNGSVKGYDEYAYSNNFPFEVPQQALWITHPKYGITYRAPVYVERLREPSKTNWVSVAE